MEINAFWDLRNWSITLCTEKQWLFLWHTHQYFNSPTEAKYLNYTFTVLQWTVCKSLKKVFKFSFLFFFSPMETEKLLLQVETWVQILNKSVHTTNFSARLWLKWVNRNANQLWWRTKKPTDRGCSGNKLPFALSVCRNAWMWEWYLYTAHSKLQICTRPFPCVSFPLPDYSTCFITHGSMWVFSPLNSINHPPKWNASLEWQFFFNVKMILYLIWKAT